MSPFPSPFPSQNYFALWLGPQLPVQHPVVDRFVEMIRADRVAGVQVRHRPGEPSRSPLALDLRDNLIDSRTSEEFLSFLRVVSLPQAELVQKPGCIDHPDLPAEHMDGGLGQIGQRNCCHITIVPRGDFVGMAIRSITAGPASGS